MSDSDAEKTRRRRTRYRHRQPTLKQRLFVRAYLDPCSAAGNGVAAARAAGYRGNSRVLATQACVNLKNSSVQRLIDEFVEASAKPALECVSRAMTATKVQFFLTKDGQVVQSEPVTDHKTRLEAAKYALSLRHTSASARQEAVSSTAALVPRTAEEEALMAEMAALPPEQRNAIRDALMNMWKQVNDLCQHAMKKDAPPAGEDTPVEAEPRQEGESPHEPTD